MVRTLFVNKQAAERGARRPAEVPPSPTRKLAMLGAGMMGAGIATVSAQAGMEVMLLDRDMAAADKGKPKPAAMSVKTVEPDAKGQAQAGGSAAIQLGAFSSEAAAAKAWTNLSKRFPYLADLGKSVAPVKTGDKTVYRLRASTGTAANAASLCGKLRVAGENCVVVR